MKDRTLLMIPGPIEFEPAVLDHAHEASTLTAPYYPEGITGQEFLPKVKAAGAILAGGLHPDIKATYFRVSHMGAVKPGDILATVGIIETGLAGCGYQFEKGIGVAAAQKILLA